MTTIAFRDGILAADTRASRGHYVMSDNFPKIFDVSDRDYHLLNKKVQAYGLAGFVHSRLILDSILEEGIQIGSTLDTDDEFTAIVITDGGNFHVGKSDDSPNIRIIEIPDNVPWAIGSGSQVASYVMYRGGDAVKAVVEACTVDPSSGGEVEVWRSPEWE